MFKDKIISLKNDPVYKVIFVLLSTAVVCVFFARLFLAPAGPLAYNDLLRVDTPVKNQKVSSPVQITGDARGYWFFEAGFPVLVLDEDKLIVGEGFATANGPWMTEEYVPFTAEVEFITDADSGYIRLLRNNVSDLPENDDSFDVPVRFIKK